jgi:nucleoside phosphorylase
MDHGHNPKRRLGITLRQARESSFSPGIANGPPLPAVNYGLVGKEAPILLQTPTGGLPKASAVVITWADAEWAALQQVFCAGGSAMPYRDRSRGVWSGWESYAANLPPGRPSGWTYWGYSRLVQVSGNTVLLFKSNTHLDWPGATYLEALIKLLAAEVEPRVILSIGTAGGAKTQDHIGTVRAVSAGTLYQSGQPPASWPEYKNGWEANDAILQNASFAQLLFPVPTKVSDLVTLCSQFNQYYRTNYTLSQLDPNGLNLGDATPQIDDQTGGGASLLTTSTFVVGTTAGTYEDYAAIEMDDAIIGEACASSSTAFGFVRNVSDPVQSAALPAEVQGNWGSAVYDTYGIYTSYNGAVAAWAMLA